ncbi:MAG: Shedu anti-phage system protein SduA domain-containing protein [Acidimicrobiia bacterium]
MMRRDELERAIRELIRLLSANVVSESAYQRFFEDHGVAWEAIQYVRAVSHPRFVDEDGRELIPDFMAENLGGLAEIVDLKAASMRLVVKEGTPRIGPSSDLSKTVRQLEEYARLFDSRRGRGAAPADLTVPANPDLVVIGGRGTDAASLHTVAATFRSRVSILTYDLVLEQMLLRYTQENPLPAEQLTYYGFGLLFAPRRFPTASPAYVVDQGLAEDHDRLSILIDGLGRLQVVILDSGGGATRIRSSGACMEIEKWCFVLCEIYVTRVATVIELRVDGRLVARTEIPDSMRIDRRFTDERLVLFADLFGQNGASMRFRSYMVLDKPPEVMDRAQLWNWAEDDVSDIAQGGQWVAEPHQYMERGAIPPRSAGGAAGRAQA